MIITITQALRNTAIIALGLLAGACVKVGHIQQTEPIRSMKFTAPPKAVAQCVQQRLSGQVQENTFGAQYIIYNSVKGDQQVHGITHYSITVTVVGANDGIAELRFVTPSFEPVQRNVPGGPSSQPDGKGVRDSAFQKYWTPVVDCVARAKGAS